MKERIKSVLGSGLIFVVAISIFFGSNAICAEKFPTRPVEVIVPITPGGGTDLVMRIIAEEAAPFLGQKMIITNKPGASGVIGITTVSRAKPDGYTIGIAWNSVLTMTPHITDVGFTLDDLSYITQVTTSPVVFCCHSDFGAKNAMEFFEYARKNPGKLTYGGDGVGGVIHFTAERIFKTMGVKLRLVPFGGGGDIIKALLGKHIDISGGSVGPAKPHVTEGTLRGLFSAALEDVPELPGTVGVKALGHPEIATEYWRGIVGPKGLPKEYQLTLREAINKALQTEKVKMRLREWGEQPVVSSGEDFEKLVRSYYKTYGVVAKDVGISKK